ncbi:AGE family epimerase/isomerase [Saccharospirillum mangrovi]|uniref:AGE family epimerase/isomerase n=1 Tax=Saccharospirillum mangrovi TaxID=2161747 RepID=UPI000D38D790|nr:AGE family epimerase/isomerase [Saccharospirillum mangrovi]
MNFYDSDFLVEHLRSILAFYDPRVVDSSGGYFHNYYDDGRLFDPGFRQLVSSTRIIVNYAQAGRFFNRTDYLGIAQHGLDYLERVHWRDDANGYAWTLRDHQPEDMTQMAYGYAFVLLAYAAARQAGLVDNAPLARTFDLLEQRFWQAEHGLYADEIAADGTVSQYRGQNANMHLCEAMIAAFEATNEARYLERARTLAYNVAVRQADQTDGLIWEHYQADFNIDWDYNKDDPKNLYRPWGFQPGHQTEWTKLLLMLHRHAPEAWMVERAQSLFDRAWKAAWDAEHGGLIYGFDPDGNWCDDDKYFWVQAESFAAAALLHQATNDDKYLACYQQLWQYSWDHFVDHQYGAWFRLLTRDNQKTSDEKSAAGAKCDYHTLGACLEVLRVQGVQVQPE